jgi:hypothetical protein
MRPEAIHSASVFAWKGSQIYQRAVAAPSDETSFDECVEDPDQGGGRETRKAGIRVRNGGRGETAVTQRTEGATIRFDATLSTIDTSTMLRLPETASKNLPSRGQVAVHGTINGVEFQTVLEPDGSFGHWMRVDNTLRHDAGISAGDTATLDIEVTKDWPEPSVPQDLATALAAAPQKIQDLWNEITPMARWEWVRWVNATKNPDTRKRRVEVSISKMKSGKRRPCCFNLSACTDPDLSKNGRLLEPGDDRP